jgi:hypothetical protein
VLRVDQLQRQPHAIAAAPNRTFEQVARAELGADRWNRFRGVAIALHRRSRDELHAAALRERGEDLLVQAVREVGVFRVRAQVLERQHRHAQNCRLCRCSRSVGRCRRGAAGHALVPPEHGAAEGKQRHQDRKLAAGDALLTTIAVIPGQDQDNRQADQNCEKRDLADLSRPLEGITDVLKTLQESPGAGNVDKSPLHYLTAAQACPEFRRAALGRVAHLAGLSPSSLPV